LFEFMGLAVAVINSSFLTLFLLQVWKYSRNDKFPKMFLTKIVQKDIIIPIGVSTASEGGCHHCSSSELGKIIVRIKFKKLLFFNGDEMMKSLRKKSKGRYLRKGLIYFLSWCLVVNTFLPAAMAEVVLAPDGVINGTITVDPLGGGTTQSMTANNGAIGHFSDFDIAAGHTVTLSQTGGPNPNALFRVFSGDGTQILGQFDANGNVFLVDPAGIVFGPESVINVNQLVASSLDISDGDFLDLDNQYEFVAGDGDIGAVVNNGTINAAVGAALIGRQVLNTGTIATGEGGFVVMVAGDRVLLSEVASDVLVEMNSVAVPEEGEGEVINDGEITAPEGTVVMAAGDVFASALELPKVSGGNGRVEQNGVVDVDGIDNDGGNVSLTASDEVVLAAGSLTSANAGTDSDAGLVVAHSTNRTTVEAGAQIEATGGHEPTTAGFEDVVDKTVEITGDYVNFAGDIDASATDGKRGKIVIDALNIDVLNGAMPVDPPDNTVYEQWIEDQTHKNNSTDVELVAHAKEDGHVLVGTLADHELTCGSGDIVLRTKYDTGGIAIFGDTAIHTTDGGNVYMLAGEDGITVGDITTDVPSSDKVTEPGKIRLLTTNGGEISKGNITTGNLSVDGGSYVEISVIADGDLTVNGDVHTGTNQVPSDTQEIGQARSCLVSEHGSVLINGEVQVEAHGKDYSTADIHIDAGQDVTINLDGGQIRAYAKTSQSGPADASVKIHAGMDIEGPGNILITDDGENQTTRSDAIYLYTKAGGVPDSATISANGEPEDSTVVTDGDAEATLDINEDQDPALCKECPTPPGLIPPLDPWAYVTHMGTTTSGDVLTDDTLTILDYTEPMHGTLILNENGEYEYTPEPGFVGQDRFAYQAITEDEVETDWVEVTIDIINELPVTDPTAASEHMGVPIIDVLNAADVSDGLAKDDLTIEIVTGPEHGDITFEWDNDSEQWFYTYTPEADAEGEYFAGTETITYSVTDGQLDGEGNPIVIIGTVEINLLNNPPVQTNDTVTVGQNETVIIDVLANDYDPDHPEYMDELVVVQDTITVQHGELILNDDNTFTYIPDPGYVGQDSFTYAVKDGQDGQELVWTTVVIWVYNALFIPAAPLGEPLSVEVSGCPSLVQWVAAELGTNQEEVQIWVAKALASPGNIQPCDACEDLKEAATILQDVEGTRVAALAEVINEFASSDAPPTEEQMASIANAIANDIEGNIQYAAAGEYLDALAKYVGVLGEMGFTTDQALQFATDHYVDNLVEAEEVGVAAYVASSLAAMGGSE
jgi:filamentous hemagglutinin family protein